MLSVPFPLKKKLEPLLPGLAAIRRPGKFVKSSHVRPYSKSSSKSSLNVSRSMVAAVETAFIRISRRVCGFRCGCTGSLSALSRWGWSLPVKIGWKGRDFWLDWVRPRQGGNELYRGGIGSYEERRSTALPPFRSSLALFRCILDSVLFFARTIVHFSSTDCPVKSEEGREYSGGKKYVCQQHQTRYSTLRGNNVGKYLLGWCMAWEWDTVWLWMCVRAVSVRWPILLFKGQILTFFCACARVFFFFFLSSERVPVWTVFRTLWMGFWCHCVYWVG